MDNPRNQDGIKKQELLTVSFGTTYPESRERTIGAIEKAMEEAFPAWSVRRAFTSQMIIDHIAEEEKVEIDSVKAALDRAAANGVERLILQPTHLMDGLEYHRLAETAASYEHAFMEMAVGAPLLTSREDFCRVMDAVTESTAEYDDGRTAICLMGHGTEAESNGVYKRLQNLLKESGFSHYYVGTVEARPDLEDVLRTVRSGCYERVVLMPLMIVAGDHVHHDMAGEGEYSWKSTFEAAGYPVICIFRGLGELKGIRQILAEHATAAAEKLTGSEIRKDGHL